MPYEAKKQKCKKEDGSSGTHAIYKKGTNEKVGCTSDPSGYMGKLYSVEETTNEDQQMTVSRQRLQEIIVEELTTMLTEEEKWIQSAEKDIEKRGTEGVCTGDKYGSPSCPPGSKRYNLAKTFRKMAKKRKKK
jgi:hypothetical protein